MAMPARGLDHLVLAVRDLDRAADFFTGLGFTLTPRAEHPFGTSNHLAIMDGGVIMGSELVVTLDEIRSLEGYVIEPLAAKLRELQEQTAGLGTVGDLRGRGLLMGIELVESRADKAPALDLAEAVYYRCLDRGLSFKTTMGNVMTLSPPLTIEAADLQRGLEIVTTAIAEESKAAGLL